MHFNKYLLAIGIFLISTISWSADQVLRIGSKRFTESYILAHVLGQTARSSANGQSGKVEIMTGLGNTAIVISALQAGSIDLYPEYAGTINQEILKNKTPSSLAVMREQLKPLGVGIDIPLGFNNSYALAMRADHSQALGVRTLSDLAAHPTLRLGLSSEFIGRADGWQGLTKHYGLSQQPSSLDHGLAYEALNSGQTDVIDIYTTDAKIERFGLNALKDDLEYFPRYDAVVLYRLDLPERFPDAWQDLKSLTGSINEKAMISMNAKAELQGKSFEVIANEHLLPSLKTITGKQGFWEKLWAPDLPRIFLQHLNLVLSSVGLASLIGLPLAMFVAPHARMRGLLLGICGLLQTVPSLALLAALISWVERIGSLPAMLALTLYSLLPIMRNTCTGLAEVPTGLKMAGKALGLTPWQSLYLIEFPLALPMVLAGIRTATSISVGTATIAAFIGAGGLGERIVTGLALNDNEMLLAGALPAAALALLFEAAFEVVARGMKARRSTVKD